MLCVLFTYVCTRARDLMQLTRVFVAERFPLEAIKWEDQMALNRGVMAAAHAKALIYFKNRLATSSWSLHTRERS